MEKRLVLRPVDKEDSASLLTLAQQASLGIVNLPKEEARLGHLIERSIRSFGFLEAEEGRSDGYYCFVLVDGKKMIGCSSIMGNCSLFAPLVTFKVERAPIVSVSTLLLAEPLYLLYLRERLYGASELCALYLDPAYRHKKCAKLLSWGRFLFIAPFSRFFEERIMAEMRGVIDHDGRSPFWEAIGAPLLGCSFAAICSYLYRGEPFNFLSFFPATPLVWNCLSEEGRRAMGRMHPHTRAAFQLLFAQGFRFFQEVCWSDGGPLLSVAQQSIPAVSQSLLVPVEQIVDRLLPHEGFLALLANERSDFRATQAYVSLAAEAGCLQIDGGTAEALCVSQGELVRCYRL